MRKIEMYEGLSNLLNFTQLIIGVTRIQIKAVNVKTYQSSIVSLSDLAWRVILIRWSDATLQIKGCM